MLRRLLLNDRRPPFWPSGLIATALLASDVAFDLPVVASNGVLIASLGGFYSGKQLQRLAVCSVIGLLVAAIANWNPSNGYWWYRIAVLSLAAMIAYRMRSGSMLAYTEKIQAYASDVSKALPHQGKLADTRAPHGVGTTDAEPSTFATSPTGSRSNFTGLSFTPSIAIEGLPETSNDNAFQKVFGRTPFLVRLIDTGVFSRRDCEVIASILHDANDLRQGLERCVLSGKLTGFQAECIENNAERRLRVGRYTLLSELGHGGMGTVYRALDRERKEEVALKLFQNLGQHLLFIRREMSVLQELAHPNLITAYAVGDSDGYHYIAMEILSGETLQDLVKTEKPMSETQAVAAVLEVAQAMQHMHQRGVVHRDIKPSNVMRLECGRYKLMDVGICRPTGALCEFDSFDLGDSNTYGTIGYAAPEQLDRNGDVDLRSDFYSLGSLLFYLLTGECYLQGNTLRERLHTLLVDRGMRDLNSFGFAQETAGVLSRLLSYDPNDRPQSDTEVIDLLQGILNDSEASQDDCRIAVLVVEDNETDFAVTERILKRSNRSVDVLHSTTFSGAFDVLAKHPACQRRPMVVLLDLNLPDSSFEQTIAELPRFKSEQTGVVAISGDDCQTTRQRCIAAGALDFVSKQQIDGHSLERTIFSTASRLLSNHGTIALESSA